MTLEQKRAVAMAKARLRVQQQPTAPAAPHEPSQPDEADMIAGAPLTRYALGAASPFMGLGQLADEATGGNLGISPHLKRVEEMKKRGMTPAADLMRLQKSRDILARLPGYEATIAKIDEQIAQIKSQGASADPSKAGLDVAGLIGTVMSPAVLAAMKIRAAGSVIGRSAQGAAVGGAMGASSPVTGGGDFWATKGAQTGTGLALGAAIPPVMDAGRKLWQVGRNVLEPLIPRGAKHRAGKVISDILGDRRAAVEAELAKNQILVPKSQPTAAEAATRAGSTELSALQRIAAQHKPSEFYEITKAQEAARLAAVRRVGETPAALQVAEKARKAAADPLYAAARSGTKPVNTEPVVAKLDLILKNNPGNRELVTELTNIKKGLQASGADPQKVSSVLDGMKASLKDEKNMFIRGILDDIKTDLSKSIPGYEKAQQVFAAKSAPVNRMQVGQELESYLTKPVGEGERAAVFAGGLRDAPRTIKRATTGAARFDTIEKALKDPNAPGAMKQIQSVMDDLSRKAEFERMMPLGATQASEGAGAIGLPATGPLNQQYMIFKTVLGRVSKAMNEKAMNELATALKLPSSTLKLLQNIPTAQRQAVIDNIITAKFGRGAIAATAELSGQAGDQ